MGRAHHEEKEEKWIQDAIKRPGSLKKSLGISKDKKIPIEKLNKASHSKNESLKRKAVLAKTLIKINKGK